MISLIRFILLRRMRRGSPNEWLALLGVGLGVAVFVAVRLTNQSVLTHYTNSVEAITGKATLSVTAEGLGFDEAWIRTIRDSPGVRSVRPVVELSAIVDAGPGSGEMLWVLGMDVLSEPPFRRYAIRVLEDQVDPLALMTSPDTVLLTERFARRHSLSLGDPLPLRVNDRTHPFVIRGWIDATGPAEALDGNIALMDIATAQWRFERVGRLDRVDLLIDSDHHAEEVGQTVRSRLPGSFSVDSPRSRTRQVERMLGAFQLNLTALAAVSLLVSLFLIYNTLSHSLVRRRREMGILRALGTSERQLMALSLLEGALLGLLGAGLGIGLGYALSDTAMKMVTATVRSLYVWIPRDEVAWDWGVVWEGMILGGGVGLLAAFFPTRAILSATPREALQGPTAVWMVPPRRLTWAGMLCLLMPYPLCQLPDWKGLPVFGYLAAAALFVGAACLLPVIGTGIGWIARRLLPGRRAPIVQLALEHLWRTPLRTAATVAALMISLGMLVGVVVMIESFRKSVELWLEQSVTADVIVTPSLPMFKQSQAFLPPRLLDRIEGLEGVSAAEGYRSFPLRYRGEEVLLAGRDLIGYLRHNGWIFASPPEPTIAMDEAAFINEKMAVRFGLTVGDPLLLPSPGGPVSLRVKGIYYDYTTDGGRVVVDRVLLAQHWRTEALNAIWVYLSPEEDPEVARGRLMSTLGEEEHLAVLGQHQFKNEVLGIFDQTFRITQALEIVALFVATMAVMNTLLISILERRREIGVFQAMGGSPGQLMKWILYEAQCIGLLGYAMGMVCGFLLSLILIFVINKQSFGWTIFLSFPPRLPWEVLGLSLLTSVTATLLPARALLRLRISEAVAYE